MSEVGKKSEEKGNPTSEIDVIGERERIIPVLQKILTLNSKDLLDRYLPLAQMEAIINSFWGTLSIREIGNNFLAKTRVRKIEEQRLNGENIGSLSNNIRVTTSFISGPNAFRGSTHTEVKSSLIVGPNAFRGLNITPLNEKSSLPSGDTYLIDINNSIIFGPNALTDVKGGIIKDSIIAGHSCLTDANVKIFNSLMFNEDGETFIVNETRGHPERYQIIPH